jgi:5'-nucleotidase
VRTFLLLSALALVACGGADEPDHAAIELGEVTVELDTYWSSIRTGEALAGNLVADAVRAGVPEAELVLVNGGAIRFDEQARPDGIYPPGRWSEATLRELLRFDFLPERSNSIVLVTLSGAELKSVLERSVASLVVAHPGRDDTEQARGWFLHLAGGTYLATLDRQAQVVSESFDEVLIEGERIREITVGGRIVEADDQIRVATTNFLADGLDGHVALVAGRERVATGKSSADYLRERLLASSPLTPALDGRIVIYEVTPPR